MRPKFLSLLAVPALALVGCSSAEPAKVPESSPAAVASESPQPKVKKAEAINPNAQTEKQFAEFAEMRSPVHGITEDLTQKQTTKALHNYCDKNVDISLSKNQRFNENLQEMADQNYCNKLK